MRTEGDPEAAIPTGWGWYERVSPYDSMDALPAELVFCPSCLKSVARVRQETDSEMGARRE